MVQEPAMIEQSLTAYVANFTARTRFGDIPADVLHLGKKSILDGLGPALTGARSEACGILRAYLGSLGSFERASTVIGHDRSLPPPFAALINGTAMHADDYDDTLQAATGKYQAVHPTAPVLCAVLAAGEAAARPGRDILAAYHVGVEVACKLFDATAPGHILNGYHSTGTCGMLGAAAAAAHLQGQPAERVAAALGIAASQAAGLQENFGTMTKPFHAGHSAMGGIMAADLAARGFTASPIILEAPRGFYRAQGGEYERERIEGRLGQPWSFVDRGIWLKPWPTGSLSHPGITLMLDLIEKHGIRRGQVKRVHVQTSENIHRTLFHHRPRTELEAKFSLEFCLAAVLVEGTLGLAHFTDEFVRRPDIQGTLGLIDYSTFSEQEARAAGYTIVTTSIRIELEGERQVSGRLDYGKGSLANPMAGSEVEAKFRDCAAFCGLPGDKADQLSDLIWNLEAVLDIRDLTAHLARVT